MIASHLLDVVRWALFGLSHVFGGSLGFGIISLSVIVRLALLPWGLKAARKGMALQTKLKALEPRLLAVKERHAKDPVKLRHALMDEYRRAGVNLLGGMSPWLLAVQLPLGWAVYHVISTGLAGGDGFLWVVSLARPDAAIALIVGSLSTIMGATMSARGGAPSPMTMAALMGLASCLVAFHMSAGTGLYWASTTSIGIVQNRLLRRAAAADRTP